MITTLSPNNEKVALAVKLKQKKYRDETGLFLVEGRHLVEEAEKAKMLVHIYATDQRYLKGLTTDAYLINATTLKKIATTVTPQGIIGLAKKPPIAELKYKRYLVLDEISDPGNLGTIIRTAAALNIDAIILSSNTVELFNEKVVRSTQGMIFQIPFIIGDLEVILPKLKMQGIYLYGMVVDDAISLKKATRKSKFAIILGNEARGISGAVSALLDERLTIPMNPQVESLNVGIAAGIALYELIK